MAACARFADDLLHTFPKLKILASSREALGVGGELVFTVPSLGCPQDLSLPPFEEMMHYEAVQLFVERARSALPGFDLTEENAPFICQVCIRLDGIPLAIELAAARVKLLKVRQIAERLDDRFRLLTGGSRTALPRQQTLRALIDWSWGLLSDPERDFLGRLSVFARGWVLEAAEQVCIQDGIHKVDVLDLTLQLANKSLVVVDRQSRIEPRYRLLETIRQYANEKLVEAGRGPTCRDRHLQYFLDLAGKAVPELHRREQKHWFLRLRTEHENFRAALEWGLDANPQQALELSGRLLDFWDIYGHLTEGRLWLSRSLESAAGLPFSPAHVQAFMASVLLAARQGDLEAWIHFTNEAMRTAAEINDARGIASSLTAMGMKSYYLEERYEEGEACFLKALEKWREVGDTLEIGRALGPLAKVAMKQGNPIRAEMLYKESLAIFRGHGDLREIAGALWNLGELAVSQADHQQAQALIRESLDIYHELEDKHGVATALRTLANTSEKPGEVEANIKESIRIFRELGDKGCLGASLTVQGTWLVFKGALDEARASFLEVFERRLDLMEKLTQQESLEGAAVLLALEGRQDLALTLLAAVDAQSENQYRKRTSRQSEIYGGLLKKIKDQIHEIDYSRIQAEGEKLSVDQAVELVLREWQK